MRENITVRRLQPKDFSRGFLESIANLRETNLSPEEAKALYRAIAKNPVYNFFVAVLEDETVVGAITLLLEQKFIHGGGKVGHIEDVATRKGFEGRGIGRMLVGAAISFARMRGCYKVILACGDHNVPFYEKLGFRKHANEMRLDLE